MGSGVIKDYFLKMTGRSKSPKRVPVSEIIWSWLGAFIGLSLISALSGIHNLPGSDQLFLIGSFGASAVLIYGAPGVTYAQPRNLVGGHIISALVGVLMIKTLALPPGVLGPLAVATAIAVMHLTKTIHPPGGATALIAVAGGAKIKALGFGFAFLPVGVGTLLLLLVALVVNNIPAHRRYPDFWY